MTYGIIMFDTSVWVNYIRGIDNKESLLLKEKLYASKGHKICPPIVQEVLQGVSDTKRFIYLKEILDSVNKLDSNPYEMSVFAAQIYFQLRKKGMTVRKPNDCLIAAYAIHSNIPLVHNDQDFDLIAKEFPLKVYK